MEWKDSAFHRAKKKNGVSALVYSIVIRFYKNRTVLLIGGCPLFFASIADKEKTVLCHFLSAPRLMKKVAERIFIAPPIWISCRCNHSLLYKSCITVHQVDDVGMVLGVLVL